MIAFFTAGLIAALTIGKIFDIFLMIGFGGALLLGCIGACLFVWPYLKR